MIEETVQIHDKYQFEIKLNYQLQLDRKTTSYQVTTYFFLPSSLGINARTYKKEDFYHNIQAHIRLKTPTFSLKQILTREDSPLKNLEARFQDLAIRPTPSNIARYEYKLKLFCCIFKSTLREHVRLIMKKVRPADVEDIVNKYATQLSEVLKQFRELRSLINIPNLEEKVFSTYLFADEYLSLLVEKYTYELLELLKEIKFFKRDTCKPMLLDLIRNEVRYRKENQYPSIPYRYSDNENLIFRKSVLKKYTENVLFLKTHLKREGRILEQILFALSAGLAMVIATGAAFFSQYKYGELTLPLFIILVVSYMFKDRIKELTRFYLGHQMQRFLFDFKTKIYSDSLKWIGHCKESFDFIKERKIPAKVFAIRNRDHITEIENDWLEENVLLYRKYIKIDSKRIKKYYHHFQLEGINDIIRLNVSQFLERMDNSKKSIYVCDDKDYYKIYGERVYHMNMIMKYKFQGESQYRRFRIVLNRDGIKRIEEVPIQMVASVETKYELPIRPSAE